MTDKGKSDRTRAFADLREKTRFGEMGDEIGRGIPPIDLAGSRARKAEIADRFREVETGFGVVRVSGHDIPQAPTGEHFDFEREARAQDRPKPGADAIWD